MARKKDTETVVSQEDNIQAQHLLAQIHEVAQDLHNSTSREQAEAAVLQITSATEGTQMALLKELSKAQDTDAADVLLAINTFSPIKDIRKESRRSLIRLEATKVYPHWSPPAAAQTPAITNNPPRFWKGVVTQMREQGEVELVLCWEQGVDYSEARALIFLLDFWHDGVKDFFTEVSGKRHIDSHIAELRTKYEDIKTTDCTLAEGRRLIEEALSVNKWRGTTPHKDYRYHLPTINNLVFNAPDPGEDRGRTFINPELEPEDVVGNFVGAWSLGDYGLAYDLLTNNSEFREGLSRDEWVERRRAWATEAHPARMLLTYIHEGEVRQSALWLPTPVFGSSFSPRKEVETGWSLELVDTPLSGTLKEMPMGTAVYKETGRHWFWTSYTLIQEQGESRIQSMTDQGANAQRLSIDELQRRVTDHNERLEEIVQTQPSTSSEALTLTEEIFRIMTQAMHYDDALIVKLPFDRSVYESAHNHASAIKAFERDAVYLERMAQRFIELRGATLRQLGVTLATLSDLASERGLNERAEHFFNLAEKALRDSIAVDNAIMGHLLLARLLIDRGERLDEAEAQLHEAETLSPTRPEETIIEAGLGDIALIRDQHEEALNHYLRAAEISPDYPGIWYTIGSLQHELKRTEEAETSLKRAIEMDPTDIRPYGPLTTIYSQSKQYARAHQMLEEALRVNPDSGYLHALMSTVYLEMGDARGTMRHLEEAERLDPDLELVKGIRRIFNQARKR